MPNTKQPEGVAPSPDDIFYDEWVSIEDAQVIAQDELKIALTPLEIKKIGGRFGCSRRDGDETEIQHGPFVEVCRKLFFVDIPKGWKSLEKLSKMYKMHVQTARKWVEQKKVKAQLFSIGLKEVWFAEEKDFRRYFIYQRNNGWSGAVAGGGKRRKFKRQVRDSKTRRYLVANGFYGTRSRGRGGKGSGT